LFAGAIVAVNVVLIARHEQAPDRPAQPCCCPRRSVVVVLVVVVVVVVTGHACGRGAARLRAAETAAARLGTEVALRALLRRLVRAGRRILLPPFGASSAPVLTGVGSAT
jgi:hypothetical protein